MKIKIIITNSYIDSSNNIETISGFHVHEADNIGNNLELDWAILNYVSCKEYDFMIENFLGNPFLILKEKKYIKYPKIKTSNTFKQVEVFKL